MKTGNIYGEIHDMEQVIYDSGVLTSVSNGITLTGLAGDTDEEYFIYTYIKSNFAGQLRTKLNINSDTGTNYGQQYLRGNGSSVQAGRATNAFMTCCITGTAANNIAFSRSHLFARSGRERTLISVRSRDNNTTSTGFVVLFCYCWNNTADEITTLAITPDQTNGFNTGSRIIVTKKADSSSSMQTGTLECQGAVGGWQKIWESTIESYITIPDSADWDYFGSNADNWTIDFFVRHNTNSGIQTYFDHYENGNNRWECRTDFTGGFIYFICRSGGSNIVNLFSSTVIADTTTLHHIALVKVADEYAIYYDGNQIAYQQTSSTDTFSGLLNIGRRGDDIYHFNGFMDEARIQNSNPFSASPNVGLTDTITVPTIPHTSDANTHLLLHGDTYPIVDSGNTGHTLTNSYVNVNSDIKKFGVGSLQFGGPDGATSITISGLDGNSDHIYRLISRVQSATANGGWSMTFNGDTGTNYEKQLMRGNGGSQTASNTTNQTSYNILHNGGNNDNLILGQMMVFATSGNVRALVNYYCNSRKNVHSVDWQDVSGGCWTNTADNLTSITITQASTNTMGVGTHFELYKLSLP